ncbi:MAG TPA: response regulator transcription factor [Aggregatilineales bacterium]|nr:response regulator transcription factor [Aggregatilineales bacterium]
MQDFYAVVLEDDQDMASVIVAALQQQGFQVTHAFNGQDGWELLKERIPHLIILDIGMPGLDGLTICEKVRSNPAYDRTPVLFLTAFKEAEDVARGLDLGGDDYITKPFQVREFQARVRVLIRPHKREISEEPEENTLQVGELSLDSAAFLISTPETSARLTSTEHRLLLYMMEHAYEDLPSSQLLEAVWEYPEGTGDLDLVRAHVYNLRLKIEVDSNSPRYIRTIHGLGYKLVGK